MSQKKPTLGRGLADLLGQARPTVPTSANAAAISSGPAGSPRGDQLTRLPVELLQRGRYQPRADLRNDTLGELADSIRRQGVIQPILVRPIGPGAGTGGSTSGMGAGGSPAEQRYEIIAGERRWRAAQLAGLTEVPAIVRSVPDEAAVAMALIENIQREDLNPLEEARAFERLIAEFGLTHQQVAEAVGRSRAAVSNLLRLTELAPEVGELVERRELDMGHARALLGLENRRKQVELALLVVKKGLSVRETEALVRRLSQPATKGPAGADSGARPRDPNVARLEHELMEKLGARVQIQHSAKGAGKVVVAYNTLEELDGILAHIQ
ncbi:MAG: ParB/RepB/Spo0J family partition protein [Gammaproteobacteria bacterium]|nr:ParB/RepB/Spo0J family partition protein [Gammaproteobacteria bacterium]MDE2251184.1 ParB/RepB/Spo0J family partition protein [Gammaproteobacteria bacterium]